LTGIAVPLPNPERDWARATELRSVQPAEIERRIGPFTGRTELLSGGLANANVRIGADRVLRLYRRDPRIVRKEEALLRRPWKSFHVPEVLAAGDDFLVLEYVPHGPVKGSAAHGAAVGRALAEIHGVAFERAGFLDSSSTVDQPFPDLVRALRDHAASLLREPTCKLPPELCPRVLATIGAHEAELRERAAGPVLLHADFKASNLHWAANEELLVLDWEFAYSGARLSDVGQLLRWSPPPVFVAAFEGEYRAHGGVLPEDWRRWALLFDVFNLLGLVSQTAVCERRIADVTRRIEETVGQFS
jgi:Phosphotransferase enzyme family